MDRQGQGLDAETRQREARERAEAGPVYRWRRFKGQYVVHGPAKSLGPGVQVLVERRDGTQSVVAILRVVRLDGDMAFALPLTTQRPYNPGRWPLAKPIEE